MRIEGREDRLRELNDAAMAFHVAQGAGMKIEGWLRTVRRLVGITAVEAAERIGVERGVIFRVERTELRGTIALCTLRRAAAALGCELVYGLAPKEGTLSAMAEANEALREQRRSEAWALKLRKAKMQRQAAAKLRWETQEHERETAQWQAYWKQWAKLSAPKSRQRLPKPGKEVEFWKREMSKALKKVLRKKGIRVR
jgi:transcriptional regulator with XRE-family HTH domain